ncbi:hypothetical protein [Streptomyces carpaticus]|uniref:hypothetical protein n=1 Tax=Streptomyces carpaticus TaxID=285558 RepID=UPI0031F93A56
MRRNLTLYTRRTVLNIAMLLRDSAVAREVRAYLLDAVEGNTAAGAGLEQRVTAIEGVLAGIGPALRDVALVVNRMDDRLRRVETRLADVETRLGNTEHIVAGMSVRLADLAGDPAFSHRLCRRYRHGRP